MTWTSIRSKLDGFTPSICHSVSKESCEFDASVNTGDVIVPAFAELSPQSSIGAGDGYVPVPSFPSRQAGPPRSALRRSLTCQPGATPKLLDAVKVVSPSTTGSEKTVTGDSPCVPVTWMLLRYQPSYLLNPPSP